MKLTILGCHSATPRIHHHPTSQVLEIRGQLFLLDCGENTQVELRRNKIKFFRINHIFISHLHGDHFFGLIGLITTYQLLSREQELHIYGPKGIKEIIVLQLKLANSWTKYPLYFHELESTEKQVIYEDEKVVVETIPLKHRIYANGFYFKEKPGDRQLDYKKAVEVGIDMAYFQKLKQGKDVPNSDGQLIYNRDVTLDPKPTTSYAFCSDTMFNPEMSEQLRGVDVLYHESTFLEAHKHLALPTRHSTAKQAAELAKLSEAKQLILGHFSTRYTDLEKFREEATTIFPNTVLAEDGKIFNFS